MIDLNWTLDVPPDPAQLAAELIAALGHAETGGACYGVSVSGRAVIVHLRDAPTAQTLREARRVLTTHLPAADPAPAPASPLRALETRIARLESTLAALTEGRTPRAE